MRKVICDVADNGAVKARIIGGRLNKRELLRVLKAVKLEYRANVRTYRQNMNIEAQKQRAKQEKLEKEKLGEESNDTDKIASL